MNLDTSSDHDQDDMDDFVISGTGPRYNAKEKSSVSQKLIEPEEPSKPFSPPFKPCKEVPKPIQTRKSLKRAASSQLQPPGAFPTSNSHISPPHQSTTRTQTTHPPVRLNL